MDEQSVIQKTTGATMNIFFTQVYGWMTLGLTITTIVSLMVLGMVEASDEFGDVLATILPLVFVVELIVVIGLSAFWQRFNTLTTAGMFIFYALLNGLFFGVVFYAYTIESVISALMATTVTFLSMATYGHLTKQDLTKIGSLAYMGLFGLIIAMIVNIILSLFSSSFAEPFSWVLTYIGLAIFLVITAYDVQRLKTLAIESEMSGQSLSKASIRGALVLYLDFINLFIRILRIMGKRR